jgi:hypothetical protein
MIVINKNSINRVVLTLTENSTLPAPYYLFQFTNQLNGNEVLFNAVDTSNFNCRYNNFFITESGVTSQDVTNGVINLFASGQWDYNVFESTGNTLQISATTGVSLETGIVVVVGVDPNVPSIYQ